MRMKSDACCLHSDENFLEVNSRGTPWVSARVRSGELVLTHDNGDASNETETLEDTDIVSDKLERNKSIQPWKRTDPKTQRTTLTICSSLRITSLLGFASKTSNTASIP